MEISAEMVLDIARIRSSIAEVDRRMDRLAASGARSANRFQDNVAGGYSRAIGRMGSGLAAGATSAMRGVQGVIGGVTTTVSRSLAAFGGLARSLFQIGVAGGVAGAAVAGVIGGQALGDAAAFEDRLLASQVFAKSTARGSGIMADVAEFNKITPFDTESLESATVGLQAAGVAADEVFGTLREIAQISKDSETLGALAAAYGKGFAKTKFDLEQINQFLERQINLVPALAKALNTDNAGVFDAASKGAITPEIMRAAFRQLTSEGGQFFGLMERRSQTLNGLWSTFVANIQLARRAGAWPVLESAKDAIREMTRMVEAATPTFEDLGKRLAAGIDTGLAALRVLDGSGGFGTGLVIAAKMAITELVNGAAIFGKAFQLSMEDLGKNMQLSKSLLIFQQSIKFAMEGAGESLLSVILTGMSRISALLADMAMGVYNAMVANDWDAVGKAISKGIFDQESAAADARTAAAKDLDFAAKYAQLFFQKFPSDLGDTAKKLPELIETAKRELSGKLAKPDFTPDEQAVLDRIAKERAKIEAERARNQAKSRINPKQPTGAGTLAADASGDGSGAAGDKVTGPTKARLPGSYQAAVNRIAGRSTNDLVLVEATMQTRILNGIRKALNEINRKMDVDTTVPGIGRFAPGV